MKYDTEVLAEGSDSDPMKVTFKISTDDIWLPVSEFSDLTTALKDTDVSCPDDTCYFDGFCSEITNNLGNLVFKFIDGTREYNVPNEYLYDASLTGKCTLNIKRHSEGYIILGNAFFKHFYTLYDIEYKQIGIALADYSGGSITNLWVIY